MKKLISALVLATGFSITALPAYAHDYGYDPDVRSDMNDIRRDRGQIAADVRHVDEERAEVADARRHERAAWWHGNYWGARRAAAKAEEERSELWAEHNKLDRDVADVRRDRADLRDDLEVRRNWWSWY